MSEKPVFKLRFDLLILDGIGTTLFALGMAKMYAGIDILPDAFQFDQTGWIMIVLGLLLMMPFVLNMLGQIRASTEGKRFK